MSLANLKREDFLYQPYYCEENIWQLCQNKPFANSYVMFIASTGCSFPMLNQRVMDDPSVPILWDYHVVLLVPGKENKILDFDTTLPFCSDIKTYLSFSFLDNRLLIEQEQPLFRIVPASEYVTRFSSDRSHMKNESGWLAIPPDWSPIGEPPSNLYSFTDVTNKEIGEVLTFDELIARFDE